MGCLPQQQSFKTPDLNCGTGLQYRSAAVFLRMEGGTLDAGGGLWVRDICVLLSLLPKVVQKYKLFIVNNNASLMARKRV
eukprot:m.762324 g.762324  ORF g.762324 m.762324 type:complete len:80 (-) comp23209_c0_seq6:7-246(-)